MRKPSLVFVHVSAAAFGFAAAMLVPHAAHAQRAAAGDDSGAVTPSRRNAFVVNGGPMLGIVGNGLHGRVNPEFQLHRDRHFGGHAFNIGLAVTIWPGEFGPSFAAAPRWQYDHQLVPGTLFFVSPYIGMDLGMGVFNIFNGGDPRFRFLAVPNAGIDVKVIMGRFLVGFRPIGLSVPLSFGEEPLFKWDVIYDIGLTLGATY